jgi:hypothetical protein
MSDVTTRGRWLHAATGVFLIALGLSWLLSNIGPRGPRVLKIYAGHGVGLGIDLLDPLGLIPFLVGEAIVVRRKSTAIVRAAIGTLLMAIGIGWMLRNARIASLWGNHHLYLYDLAALLALVVGTVIVLYVGLREWQSTLRWNAHTYRPGT